MFKWPPDLPQGVWRLLQIGGGLPLQMSFSMVKKIMPLILLLTIFCMGQLRGECSSEASKLTQKETIILRSFFRSFFWDSEGG